MDLHKSTSSFCCMDKEGIILREQRIPTTKEGVTKFIASLGSEAISIALEPVSQWYVYADHLESLGCDVHLAHPRKLKAIATATSKTDKLDARVLADHLRTNHLPEAYHAPKEVRTWKEMVRSRSALVSLRVQTKNRVHAVLFKNGLVSPVRVLFTNKGLAWLKKQDLPPQFKISITAYLNTIAYLDKEITTLEQSVREMVSATPDMKRLTTIPGIGTIYAATIMAEIGTITRFKNPQKLQAYAGLVPWVRNSGGNTKHGHLTKQGSVWLRYAVVEAAVTAARLRASSDLKDYYLKIQKNKNSKTAAVATARKLLAIIWSVLKNERNFAAHYPSI